MSFRLRDACRAANISPPMLLRWLDRGTVTASRRDRRTTGSGDHRGFSRASIIRFAITRNLTRLGVSPRVASNAASLFDERLHPYAFGRTLLVVQTSGPRIINADYADTLDAVGRPIPPSIILELGQIVKTVDAALQETAK